MNPLYPFPTNGENGEVEEESSASPGSGAALNPLRDFLVVPEASSPFSGGTQATECPAASVWSQGADCSPKRTDETISPTTPGAAVEDASGPLKTAGGSIAPDISPTASQEPPYRTEVTSCKAE